MVGLVKELLEVLEGPVRGMDREIIGNVIAVVLERGWVEGEQPDGGHAEFIEIIELLE